MNNHCAWATTSRCLWSCIYHLTTKDREVPWRGLLLEVNLLQSTEVEVLEPRKTFKIYRKQLSLWLGFTQEKAEETLCWKDNWYLSENSFYKKCLASTIKLYLQDGEEIIITLKKADSWLGNPCQWIQWKLPLPIFALALHSKLLTQNTTYQTTPSSTWWAEQPSLKLDSS